MYAVRRWSTRNAGSLELFAIVLGFVGPVVGLMCSLLGLARGRAPLAGALGLGFCAVWICLFVLR